MPITTEAPQGFEIVSSSTAAVVGQHDAVAQRVAGVLNQHRYQVVHHHSPQELLQDLPEPRETAAPGARRRRAAVPRAKAGQRPALYVFNCDVPGLEDGFAGGPGAWLEALKAVSRRAPGTAILVVVRPGQAPGLITDVIRAGADEILSAGDAEIDELVWLRVQSALARAEVAPGAASAPWDGGERRVGERRRGAPPASHVVETWEAPASDDEVRAARERVRAVLGHLPSARERQGPLADLLGVTAPALRGDSGRLDARKIADRLGVPLARLAHVTPISRQALHLTPDSARAQAALDPFARVLDVLGTVLPPEQVRAWLHAPHARLNGETPLHAMLDGRAEQVARMVQAARDGGVD